MQMSTHWLFVIALFVVICQSRDHAVEQVIYFQEAAGGVTTEHFFALDFEQVEDWPIHVKAYEISHGFPENGLRDLIHAQLIQYAFPQHVVDAEFGEGDNVKHEEPSPIFAHIAVKSLFRNNFQRFVVDEDSKHSEENVVGHSFDSSIQQQVGDNDEDACRAQVNSPLGDIVFSSEKEVFKSANPACTGNWLSRLRDYYQNLAPSPPTLTPSEHKSGDYSSRMSSSMVPPFLRSRQKFVVYQSLGVDTGGTIALSLLHRQLIQLGYDSLLCDSSNMDNLSCSSPSEDDVVITGEWCSGVLQQHGKGPAGFTGRGIQYHLGFHHFSDLCHGHISAADSHQLKSSLSARILSGYFLGCPMVDRVRELFTDLLFLNPDSKEGDSNGYGGHYLTSIKKENLILLDMDILHDYPPHNDIEFTIPDGYKLLQLRDVPRHRMGSVLLRTKIVIDLAMPGPERLAGEAILLGAIPIISKQWNGASGVDFPGVRKVDSLNNSDISEALAEVALTYSDQLKTAGNSYFQGYISSLWQRLHNTVDVYVGSAGLQFVLVASSLEEEMQVTFQVIGLLYLFPLASIDVYVRDDMWFSRHHYLFMTMMKESGYVRYDRFDPSTFDFVNKDTNGGQHRSFLRIRLLTELEMMIGAADVNRKNETVSKRTLGGDMFPSREKSIGLIIYLPCKVIPPMAQVIFQLAHDRIDFERKEKVQNSSAFNGDESSSVHVLDCGHPSSSESRACGAMFSPLTSTTHFAQIIHENALVSFLKGDGGVTSDEVSSPQSSTDRSEQKAMISWRTVCGLMMTNSCSTASSLKCPQQSSVQFVDSVVNTVSWQRLLKMEKDTSDSVCGKV